MAVEYHSIFSPENLFISSTTEYSNACILSTDSGLKVLGTSTDEIDIIDIIWSTKDVINHGYCKYNEQADLSGVVIEFEIEALEKVVPYAHTTNPQYLKIEEANGYVYKVPIATLGVGELFTFETIPQEEEIDIDNRWIYDNDSFNVYYIDKDGVRNYLLKDTEYKIDFTDGVLTLINNPVPENTKIYVKGYKHSESKYRIDFNKLTDNNGNRIFIDSVNRFSLPVTIDSSILVGDSFLFEIKNLEVTRGQLWQKPAQIKQHGFLLNDKYEYTKQLNPKALIYNIKKLGYANKVVLHLGRGDFLNFNNINSNILDDINNVNYDNIFNVGFSAWFSNLITNAKENNFDEAIIVIPMQSKHLEMYNQLTKTGASINRLNPIHSVVISYLKALMRCISDLAEDFPITFLLQGFGWGSDSSGNLAIYDTFTLNKFEEESMGEYLYGSGNYNDYNIPDGNSTKIASWLSSKLSETLEMLCETYRVGVIVDSVSILRTDYLDKINNSYKEWYSYTNSIYISNNIWNREEFHRKIWFEWI